VFAERNDDYWQDSYTMPDGKQYQLPFADEIAIVAVPDEASRIAALRTGRLTPHSESLAVRGKPRGIHPELNKWDTNYNGSFLIGMREDKEPFNDKNVRRALSMALNRDVINSSIFGGSPILDFPFHPTWNSAWGLDVYTPLEDYSEEFQEGFTYNPEKARQLLADAGYPDGFKATVEYPTNILHEDLLSLVADYWAAINVELTLKPLASAESNTP
jgi:peptide/nickel transport system substrate-binding protein